MLPLKCQRCDKHLSGWDRELFRMPCIICCEPDEDYVFEKIDNENLTAVEKDVSSDALATDGRL